MSRLNHLRARMRERSLPGLLVTQAQNRRYLSGFSGSTGWLLVTDACACLLTDSRYWEQVKRECPEFELVKVDNRDDNPFVTSLRDLIGGRRFEGPLGFEPDAVPYLLYSTLQEFLPRMALQPAANLVEDLRLLKDADEVRAMQEAARIADEALAAMQGQMRPGTTERDFAARLAFEMRLRGADKESFDAIVASGPNGALPHARPGPRAFEPGELVTVDFGATCHGYNSDMTRTLPTAPVTGRLAEIYRIVRHAQRTALTALRPGMTCGEADAIARGIIDQAGYGANFGHSLGHGIGLAVHESPRLRRNDSTVLQPGMVVTVEPGIYVADLGGVRIEDMALITDTGYQVLTHSPTLDI